MVWPPESVAPVLSCVAGPGLSRGPRNWQRSVRTNF